MTYYQPRSQENLFAVFAVNKTGWTINVCLGEVTADSQEASANSLIEMAGQLSGASSEEDGAGSDEIESTAGSMAVGIGNLLGAAGGTAKKVRFVHEHIDELYIHI